MIVVVSRTGDHSNRLFQNLYFESLAREYGQRFCSLDFEDMKPYYGLRRNPFAPVIRFAVRGLRKLGIITSLDFNSPEAKCDSTPLLEGLVRAFGTKERWGGIFCGRLVRAPL